MNKKTFAILLLMFLALSSAASAMKIHEWPFMSDVHLGFINGVGAGVNIGLNAGFDLSDQLRIGPELEQILTTVNNSTTLGGTRFGGFLRLKFTDDLALNLHLGTFGFQPSGPDFSYTSDGTDYIIRDAGRYTGKYQAISLDYKIADYVIAPKLYLNTIDGQGHLTEFDLNFAYSFNHK